MRNVFVDTNIIIDFTKGFDNNLNNLINLQKQNLVGIWVNPIVITEFFNDKSLKNKNNFDRSNKLFNFFKIVNLTGKIGFLAGEILRTNQVNFTADALIAATCLNNNLELVTNSVKDFKKVKSLKFFRLDNKKF